MFRHNCNCPTVFVMEQRVLVTGANGFLGSHVVKQLLLAGYRVRGTLRNIEDRGTIVAALKKLVPDAKHELELVDVDLLRDDGWDSAMSGCSSVIHTAGPVPRVSEDIPGDIFLDHSVNGALRVLKAAVQAGVKKVVMTSSVTTVICTPVPIEEGKIYTEKDWTDADIPNLDVYGKAKTVAEKAAWDFVAKLPEDNKLSLTMLLPSALIGPLLIKPRIMGYTLETVNIVMNHVYPGSPKIMALYSDVRDLAECHVKALTTPAADGQRIIHMNEASFMPDTVKMIADEFRPQGYTIYANTIPAFFLWLPSLFDKRIVQSGVLDRIDKELLLSTKKLKDIFGFKLRPLNDSLIEMIYSMVDFGITFKANNYKQVGSRAVVKAER